MTDYAIADLHFGDARLCGGSNSRAKSFSSVAVMGAAIVARWNEVVSDDETVHVLGDVGRGRDLSLVRELRGRKRHIAGNNDDLIQLASSGMFYSIDVAKWLPGFC